MSESESFSYGFTLMLRAVAEDLHEDDADIDLAGFASEFAHAPAIIKVINEELTDCGRRYRVELIDPQLVSADDRVKGVAIYAARIDTGSGGRRLFGLGPYERGLWHCRPVADRA